MQTADIFVPVGCAPESTYTCEYDGFIVHQRHLPHLSCFIVCLLSWRQCDVVMTSAWRQCIGSTHERYVKYSLNDKALMGRQLVSDNYLIQSFSRIKTSQMTDLHPLYSFRKLAKPKINFGCLYNYEYYTSEKLPHLGKSSGINSSICSSVPTLITMAIPS